jgi:hypothetical protein
VFDPSLRLFITLRLSFNDELPEILTSKLQPKTATLIID